MSVTSDIWDDFQFMSSPVESRVSPMDPEAVLGPDCMDFTLPASGDDYLDGSVFSQPAVRVTPGFMPRVLPIPQVEIGEPARSARPRPCVYRPFTSVHDLELTVKELQRGMSRTVSRSLSAPSQPFGLL
jgi:hypothetical protein